MIDDRRLGIDGASNDLNFPREGLRRRWNPDATREEKRA
jgi:hypothetical protein